MTVKRWTTGPDHSVTSKLRPIAKSRSAPKPSEQTRRDARRSYAFRAANADSVEMIMAAWTNDTFCSVCRVSGSLKPWEAACFTQLSDGLYVYPTCGSKACHAIVKSDAIHENPNIH